MAEFQTASAAIGLAGDVVKFVQYLRKVKAAMDTVDDDLDSLIKELDSYDGILRRVEDVYIQKPDQKTLDPEQQKLWYIPERSLQHARECLKKLDDELRKVYGSFLKSQESPNEEVRKAYDAVLKSRGPLETFRKQHRLSKASPRLAKIRGEMSSQFRMLQLWLTSINQASSRAYHRDTSAQLKLIEDGIRSIVESLDKGEQTSREHDNASYAAAYSAFARASIDALNESAASLESHGGANLNEHFDTPQPVDSCYVGREQEAADLAASFFDHPKHHPQQQNRFVVHGVGGSGKTQFVCKFAQDHQDRFWGVFWIDGRSHEQLKQSLSQNVAKIGGVERNHKAALNWLATQKERWLLIIDNADDPAINLMEYLPTGGRGYVLITTRNPGFQSLGNVEPGYFKFHGMRNHEANALLIRSAKLESSEDVIPFVTKIVETLGYLAIAIAVAGSAIGSGFCRIQDYLRYFEDKWEERRRSTARGSTKPRADSDDNRETRVEATFDISYRAIAQKGSQESRDALQLLKTFAFLHCENVRFDFLKDCVENAAKEEKQQQTEMEAASMSHSPMPIRSWSQWTFDTLIRFMAALTGSPDAGFLPDLLRDGRKERRLDRSRISNAMRQLTQYSLATFNSKSNSWSMHPLVHRWAQEMIGMRVGERFIWCSAAANLLCSCVNIENQDEELMRQILPHVNEVRKEQAKIEERFKDNRMARSRLKPTFELSSGRQRALMKVKFGIVYAQNGRWEDAEVLHSAVQRYTVEVLGFRDAKTRRITKALAGTLWHLGRGDDSAKLLEQLVEECTKYCGPAHRETLMAKHQLGDSRWLQGRVSEAKELFEESLSGLKALCGSKSEEDEDTLTAMDSLGKAILLFGTEDAVSKARNLHRTTFKARSHLYGPYDLKTLTSRELFCSAATWKGDHQDLLDADKGLAEIIEVRTEKLGREHAFTLLAMLWRAKVKVELREFDAAEELFKKGLPIAERNHGTEHHAVLYCRFHLGRMRCKQHRWAEGRDILVDVTDRQRVALQGRGRFHYDRIGGLLELARAHNELEEHAECDEVVAETLLGFEQITSVEHPWAKKLKADHADWKRRRPPSAISRIT